MDLLTDIVNLLLALLVLGGGALILGPVWWVWTFVRRRRLRALLRSRGWPPVLLTPDLLVYPDSVFRKIPPYEEVLAAPLGTAEPAGQLKAVLHLLAPPGSQWVRL